MGEGTPIVLQTAAEGCFVVTNSKACYLSPKEQTSLIKMYLDKNRLGIAVIFGWSEDQAKAILYQMGLLKVIEDL